MCTEFQKQTSKQRHQQSSTYVVFNKTSKIEVKISSIKIKRPVTPRPLKTPIRDKSKELKTHCNTRKQKKQKNTTPYTVRTISITNQNIYKNGIKIPSTVDKTSNDKITKEKATKKGNKACQMQGVVKTLPQQCHLSPTSHHRHC